MEFFQSVLLILAIIAVSCIAYLLGKKSARKDFETSVPEIRKDAIKHSRSVIAGQMSEQIAPYFPDFPYKPTEARFIGKPIDFVVFKGMDEKKIEEVIFVEVKTGQSGLNNTERSLRNAIEEKKVSWFEYRK